MGLAQSGHAVRALAPITDEAFRSGDPFAARHPEIDITRFVVPYFETAPNVPPPDNYRKLEGDRIREQLAVLIARERPAIIFVGRETFAWHVPDLALAHSIPFVVRMAGATTAGILNKSHPEAEAQKLLHQFRKADLLIAPAEHLAESLRRLGLTHVQAIRNAADLQQFSPRPKNEALLRQLAIEPGQTVVLHASNMKWLKRPLDIVDSAEKALRRNPGLVYVIVGDGACRQPMEDACRQKGILDKFRFVGWVDYARVPEYINLSDIVVMASEVEALARIYVETQACGRLLLTSDIPAAREVVDDGETGLLFKTGDIDDLAARTLVAAADPSLRATIGRNARERVQIHSLDAAVRAYTAAFQNILRQRREG